MTGGCPRCDGRWPDERYRIGELEASVAYLHEDQFFPGWTLVVLKRHATELAQLDRRERADLIEDVTAVARALADEFSPVKLNYELLGNQVAHIHWHVIPRLAGDPVPSMPVWVHQHTPRVLPEAARDERIARLRTGLTRSR